MEEREFLDWFGSFTDAEAAFESMKSTKETFRVNALKIPLSIFDSVSKIKCSKVNWSEAARILEEEMPIGRTFEYFLGYLHPQSLSSMIPPLILDPKEGEKVLDLAAAPGSKTTQMAAMMNNKGMVVANDLPEREIFIVNTLARLGVLNVLVTNRDALNWPLRNKFDKVLLDAPCTSLGSHVAAIRRFSIIKAQKMAQVQKKMVVKAFDALKEGGTLVYSTCTYTQEENEDVVSYLFSAREEAKLERVDLGIPHESGFEGFKDAWRIYPQTFGSEGFFITKIKKGER